MLFAKKLVHRRDLLPESENDDENDRCHGEQVQRHFDVHGEKVDRHEREKREALDDHADDPRDVVADGVEVARQARHQVAGPVFVIEMHVLVLDLLEKLVADAVERALRDMLVRHAVEIDDNGAQDRDADHRHDQRVEALFIVQVRARCILAGQVFVDDLLREKRYGQLQRIVQDRRDHR